MTLREEIEKRIDLIVKEKPHAGFNFNRHADSLETLVNDQITSFAERVKKKAIGRAFGYAPKIPDRTLLIPSGAIEKALEEALRGKDE